ncbi:MAG: hypothetical protein ACK4ND_01865 [Cytophagaceae bacterium]
MALVMLFQLAFPTISYALTSGPSQPEVQSFEPVGTSDMVDLFTGDFHYNIPLFDLPGPNGGYPFNLIYNSGIGMDQEASWVGLGWNLNPGAITRQMRGLPDELNGEHIETKRNIKPNVTFGGGVGANLEIFGGDLEKVGDMLKLTMGLNIYYNNYRGVGYSLQQGVSIHSQNTSGPSAGLGLNLSLDSQDGVGANASVSLSDKINDNTNTFSMGLGYNSRAGLSSFSMGFTTSKSDDVARKNGRGKGTKNETVNVSNRIGGNSTLSVFSGGYSPQVAMPMRGRNVNVTFKSGLDFFGVFGNGYVNGFFSTQYLKDRETYVSAPAYGYLNLGGIYNNDEVLMDFNREKDGMIRKNSPNLAIPSLTYDVYSVTGQGIGGMFRPFRADIGTVFDPKVESNIVGGSLGLEPGLGGGPHIGGSATLSHSSSVSNRWTNDVSNIYKFRRKEDGIINPLHEPVYFKSYGEHTPRPANYLDKIGGEKPARIGIEKGSIVNQLRVKDTENRYILKSPENTGVTQEREKRNLIISPNKNNLKENGFSVVNTNGLRYVYGLPAMNKQHVECMYTAGAQGAEVCSPTIVTEVEGGEAKYKHNNTEQFFSKTKLPPYAHSYLLTEVLGSDYIDVDGNGPSNNDFGYWVKFNYNKTPNYNWRVPFWGSSYNKGIYTDFADDKASYMYGTKDVHYLGSVETKTHKAVFHTSYREDSYGASGEFQNVGSGLGTAAKLKKLDTIKLYLKVPGGNDKLIKTVHFEYSYELCKGVHNNSNEPDPHVINGINSGGKLTLKKVYFTYENNTRGRLSPYEFNYNENDPLENPDYHMAKYDRWGNFKDFDNECSAMEFPYVEQFKHSDSQFENKLHRNISAWNLKEIKLPSGGKISVEYESDDYAYVQNKTAMQMFQIASLAPGTGSVSEIDHQRYADASRRRVYFELEHRLPVSMHGEDETQKQQRLRKEIDKYLDKTGTVYFKVFMDIRKMTDNRRDFVQGYATISNSGIDQTSAVSGEYTRGFIEMDLPKVGKKSLPYHPFSVAAWQYIRTINPHLSGVGPFDDDPNANKSAAMNKVRSLVQVFPEIARIFSGFNKYAHAQQWGKNVHLSRSVIRLNSPDKIKYGGGLRVKKIKLNDEWNVMTGEPSSVYGQVYDYRMEENGEMISSGVAAYEPLIGGDETALRNVKEFPERIPLKTNNNLFFELPVNESYYPAPTVGYRSVTVTSLATHNEKIAQNPAMADFVPEGIATTGRTVHEFYTAKEFPVIVDETDIKLKPFDLFVPIPLIGQIAINNMTASQGYSIVLNDMHGKPKKVTHYGQDAKGDFFADPLSWTEYKYSIKEVYGNPLPGRTGVNNNISHYELDNYLPTLVSDKNGVTERETSRLMGVEYEFFHDMRHIHNESTTSGVDINSDVLFLGFIVLPVIVPWPTIGMSSNDMRISVSNKVIHKFGIPTGTEVYHEGSRVSTKNVLYDDLTGQPVLTTVTNNYDDPIFHYKIPAHFAYEGMGAAYKNTGLSLDLSFGSLDAVKNAYPVQIADAGIRNMLVPGDEFIESGGQTANVIYTGCDGSTCYFATRSGLQPGSGIYSLVRSGRRNHLEAFMGQITTLGDKNNASVGDPTIREQQ